MTLLKSLLAVAFFVASLTVWAGCTPSVGDSREAQPGVTTPSETEFDFQNHEPAR